MLNLQKETLFLSWTKVIGRLATKDPVDLRGTEFSVMVSFSLGKTFAAKGLLKSINLHYCSAKSNGIEWTELGGVLGYFWRKICIGLQ